jgi:hypothetical protein
MNDEYTVSSIYHICGDGVLDDSHYKNFMNKFPAPVHVCVLIFFVIIWLANALYSTL